MKSSTPFLSFPSYTPSHRAWWIQHRAIDLVPETLQIDQQADRYQIFGRYSRNLLSTMSEKDLQIEVRLASIELRDVLQDILAS